MIPKLIRAPMLWLTRILGYEVIKINRESALYGAILTGATYSPWHNDAEFMQAYTAISQNTMVDIFRCYELWQLIDQLRDIPGELLEIGLWRGGSGALIAKRAASSNIDGAVFLCDTFTGVVKAGQQDNSYIGGEHADTSYEMASSLLATMNLENASILRGVVPDETAAALADRRFRFVHIDVDVYRSAKEIVDLAWPRLSVGGVIVYDDYGTESTLGVTRFVDEQKEQSDRLTIYNLNGHAVVVKLH